MRKFEQHFKGKANEGMRQEIRKQVEAFRAGETVFTTIEQAIMQLGKTRALTTRGLNNLRRVACDYFLDGLETRERIG